MKGGNETMKTTRFNLMAALLIAGLAAMTSCENNIEPEKQEVVEGPVLLMAEGFNPSTSTKTSVSGNTVQWVNEDKVYLNNTLYTVSVSGTDAFVTAVLPSEQPVYGSYACVLSEQSKTPTVTIPSSYEWKSGDGERQIIALPMAAYSNKPSNTITFKHLTAAVEITIKNSTSSTLYIDEVTLISDTYRLNGECQLNLTAANFGITANVSEQEANRTEKITFSVSDPLGIAPGATHAIQVPILPIGEDNLTIHISSHNNNITGVPVSGLTHTFNYTAPSAALGRNQMLSAKVEISPKSANVFSKGTFSVSADKAIYFSKGNLQATTSDGGTTWSWAFATPQNNYIGAAAANTYVTASSPWFDNTKNGTVDLFGWVSSGSILGKSGTGAEYGIAGVTSEYEYFPSQNGLKHDWGETIGDGWFTLSKAQWSYLMDRNSNGANISSITYGGKTIKACFFKATVDGVAGLVLFPDDFSWPSAIESLQDGLVGTDWPRLNHGGKDFDYYLDAAQWGYLEAAGCVFLPAAGRREGNSVQYVPGATDNTTPNGDYWSSTNTEIRIAALRFSGGNGGLVNVIDTYGTNAFYGMSVRLAYPAN